MSKCIDSKIGKYFINYISDSLDAKKARKFEDHIFYCDFCSKKVELFNNLKFIYNQNREELLKKFLNLDYNKFFGYYLLPHSYSKLSFVPGKLANGNNYIIDITKFHNLLIASISDSEKNEMLNTIVCNILYKMTPNEVKFLLIATKSHELRIFQSIPHLYHPLITIPESANNILIWTYKQLEIRLRLFASLGVRNIEEYNNLIKNNDISQKYRKELKPLPYIMIIIDELADLMTLFQANIEEVITRLAQLASAVGIHIIAATIFPIAEVITGIISAGFSSRLSFKVSSKAESRIIIHKNGAEKLSGKGDMLFLPSVSAKPIKIYGVFINKSETHRLINFCKRYYRLIVDKWTTQIISEVELKSLKEDKELYNKAMQLVIQNGYALVSELQNKLGIEYNRAAQLIDIMEKEGIVESSNREKPKKVLVDKEYLKKIKNNKG